jgi:hypothetical protein
MPTYFEIIGYLTALFICYNIRVYISYLWHNKKDNNHKTETNDRNKVSFLQIKSHKLIVIIFKYFLICLLKFFFLFNVHSIQKRNFFIN